MTPDEIATLMNNTAGQRWGDEAHFQRFAAAFEKRISAASMPAIKLAMEAERENGARAEREACAQVCETLRPSKREFDKSFYDACTDCAEVIRGRSSRNDPHHPPLPPHRAGGVASPPPILHRVPAAAHPLGAHRAGYADRRGCRNSGCNLVEWNMKRDEDRQCCDGICEQGRFCPYREASTPTPDLWPRPKTSALVQATAIAAVAILLGLVIAEVLV